MISHKHEEENLLSISQMYVRSRPFWCKSHVVLQVYSTGRGGAGNIRSPSRDHHAPTPPDQHEIDVLRSHVEAAQNGVVSL